MSKKTNVPFESNVSLNLGEINITTGVLESIAAKAASEVEGVYKLHASVQNEIGGFVTRSRDRIGVKVRREENAIVIDTESCPTSLRLISRIIIGKSPCVGTIYKVSYSTPSIVSTC